MSVDLAHWGRRYEGAWIVLSEPDGGMHLRICANAPLRSLRSLVPRTARIRRFVTREGAHAACAAWQTGGRRNACGLVAGETTMWLVDAVGVSIDPTPIVDDVLRSSLLGGSPDRVRWFPYCAPMGWLGLRRTLATVWLAPTYPRDPARLVVCDAVPASAIATRDLLWPARKAQCEELAIGGFSYLVQLHDGARHVRAFRRLLASIETPERSEVPSLMWMSA